MAAPSNLRTEMMYLATETADDIRDLKSSSWRVIAAYTVAFAYMISAQQPNAIALSLLMGISGLFAAYMTFYFYPVKLGRRRELLRRVHKQYFSNTFKTIYGNVNHIPGEDMGDKMHRDLGTLYILVLLAIFVITDPSLGALLN